MDLLTVIRRALAATGNNLIDALNDGSDEWQVSNAAFDRSIDWLVAEHDWPFEKKVVTLQRTGNSNLPPYKHAFAFPQNAWHLRAIIEDKAGTTVPYAIVGNEIHAFVDSGLLAVYIDQPPPTGSDPNWHPAATEILTQLVEVGCLRGLNEDYAEATSREDRVVTRLMRAGARTDQQSPPRRGFNSTIARARRRRRG
jgi:hypothetical protein